MLLRGARILGLGIALALPQVVLWILAVFLPHLEALAWLLLPIIALYFYLPGVAGFLVVRPGDEGCSGAGGGCLVGVINFVFLAIFTLVVLNVELSLNPGPHYTSAWDFFVEASFGLLAIQALLSIVGGGLGGWIGGARRRHQAMLARERARLARQRSASPAAGASPGEDQ